MSPQTIHKIIDKQIRVWEMNRDLLVGTDDGSEVHRRPVVTVSRQMGSCHGELAAGLANRLGLQVHGGTLIDEIARDKGLERRIVEALDERTRSEMKIWVSGLLNRRLFSNDEFAFALAKTVKTLAALGGVVFVGRGANWILDAAECMRVRVIASMENRVARVAREQNVDAVEAERLVRESDAVRTAFIRRNFDADWNDAGAFDLVVNTDYIDTERIVELVVSAMAAKGMFAGRA